MARYLPKLSVTSEQCRVSRPQIPQSTHGMPGTMTPLLARKTVAFYDSGFPTEARVITKGQPFHVTIIQDGGAGNFENKNKRFYNSFISGKRALLVKT